jgi:hypothetical protein
MTKPSAACCCAMGQGYRVCSVGCTAHDPSVLGVTVQWADPAVDVHTVHRCLDDLAATASARLPRSGADLTAVVGTADGRSRAQLDHGLQDDDVRAPRHSAGMREPGCACLR